MKNDAIIKSIQILLNEYKNLSSQGNQNSKDLKSIRYLLNQSIREYEIPSSNWHISVAARDLWDSLTTDSIWNYHYRDVVGCNNLQQPMSVELFRGASKEGGEKELFPNDSFLFNELFHEDHVIPVSMILDELINKNASNEADIKTILDNMHICVILKEEDRKIGRTTGRTLDFNQTIQNVYNANGIYLV